MNAHALYVELETAGVHLTANGDRLRIRAPQGAVTESIRAKLTANKPALLKLLQSNSEQRLRLLAFANAEYLDSDVIERLDELDVVACAGLSDECLIAYVRALHDGQQLELGKALPEDTARAMCRHCGPVFIHPSIAAIAPMIDDWPRVLGCRCCHVRNRRAMPRPRVHCGDCKHFQRDSINPPAGAGHCIAQYDPAYPYPHSPRICGGWKSENS
jgi:hypothetical protein